MVLLIVTESNKRNTVKNIAALILGGQRHKLMLTKVYCSKAKKR